MKAPKFTDPAEVNRSLHQVALYLTAWETLRSCIIERVKGLYTEDWTLDDKGGLRGTVTNEYKKRVIALYPKNELHACTIWLLNNGAFNENDVEQIALAQRHRNSVAHEIVQYITGHESKVDRNTIGTIYQIVKKLDIWWLTEIDLPSQKSVPDATYYAAQKGEATGGYSLLLELILPIFDGDFDNLLDIHSILKKQIE